MLVWGGSNSDGELNTGWRYNPESNTWKPISTAGAPKARSNNTAVWTGTEMLIWGGLSIPFTHGGGRYVYYADLGVTLDASPDPVETGKKLTYTILLKNNGLAEAQSAVVEAPLPPHTSFVSATVTAGSGWSVETPNPGKTGVVKFTKAALARGESAHFQIVLHVNRAAAEDGTLSLTASASSDCVDFVTEDNSASLSTTVLVGDYPLFLPYLTRR